MRCATFLRASHPTSLSRPRRTSSAASTSSRKRKLNSGEGKERVGVSRPFSHLTGVLPARRRCRFGTRLRPRNAPAPLPFRRHCPKWRSLGHSRATDGDFAAGGGFIAGGGGRPPTPEQGGINPLP